ncbi:MAG: TonB family protein [Desulfomonilaceae bacterium]
MKSMLTALILVLMVTVCAIAVENPMSIKDQMIIDRSTRVKPLNDYALLTRDAIQRSWKTPLDLSVPGALKGRITINYTVTRSGALEALELVRGSGNHEMDDSLIAAIRAAAPFPPFPDDVAARKLMIKAKFVIADVPAVPVTTVDLKTDKSDDQAPVASPETESAGKKFIWGTPAGSADVKTDAPDNEIPPRPEPRKYQWGLK